MYFVSTGITRDEIKFDSTLEKKFNILALPLEHYSIKRQSQDN